MVAYIQYAFWNVGQVTIPKYDEGPIKDSQLVVELLDMKIGSLLISPIVDIFEDREEDE